MQEKIIHIKQNNIALLKQFISNMGSSSNTFRYFENRKISCIKKHLLTVLILKDEEPVAYGHLDVEQSNIWLGVCVIEAQKGFGYGKKIMTYLTKYAKDNKLKEIILSVDKNNIGAIRMYEKFGFLTISEKKNIKFMNLQIGEKNG